jgi:hypothetical protein
MFKINNLTNTKCLKLLENNTKCTIILNTNFGPSGFAIEWFHLPTDKDKFINELQKTKDEIEISKIQKYIESYNVSQIGHLYKKEEWKNLLTRLKLSKINDILSITCHYTDYYLEQEIPITQ